MKSEKSILLSVLLCICLMAPSLSACSRKGTTTEKPSVSATEKGEDATLYPASLLLPSEDRGQEYIDSFVFLGESTTYHLKSRGVLRDGTGTRQVWAPESGTVNLDPSIVSLQIVYPETGEQMPLAEALKKKQPARMLLTFGLNGAMGNVRRGADYFKGCYRSLIRLIQDASPSTNIILQSAFPVASNMDMTHYSATVDQLNDAIRQLNRWTAELAEECGLGYLNTFEVLTDDNGRLRSEYQVGDGHHLTASAYREILGYIRTHANYREVSE